VISLRERTATNRHTRVPINPVVLPREFTSCSLVIASGLLGIEVVQNGTQTSSVSC
jgi:hypothetical protein